MGITVTYTDISAGARDAFAVSGGAAFYSVPGDIRNHNLVFMPSANPCEGYDFALDGDAPLLPGGGIGGPWGFVSEAVSGPDGAFATPAVPALTVTAPGTSSYTSSGLWMRFDPERGVWPLAVTVEWRRLGALIDRAEFAVSGPEAFFGRLVEDYTQIDFRFHALKAGSCWRRR
jgi:hypothetical protein